MTCPSDDDAPIDNENGQGADEPKTIDAFIGLLVGKTAKPLSIDEMNDIIAASWAGEN